MNPVASYVAWATEPLTTLDNRLKRQGRLVCTFALATVPLGIIYAAVQYWLGPSILVYVMCMAIVGGLVVPIVLRKSKSPQTASTVYLCIVMVSIVLTTWLQGKLSGSGAMWLCCLPLAAGLLGGRRAVLLWAMVALGWVLLIGVGAALDGPLLPNEHAYVLKLFSLPGQIVLVSVLAFVYEHHRARIDAQLNLANQALVEAANEAQLATEIKSRFLANVGHELRTPMHGVLGMASLLQCGSLSGVQRTQLGVIEDSGRVLLELIDDLLDTAKIEAGMLIIERAPFCPAQLVKAVVDAMVPIAQSSGLKINFELNEVPGLVLGDPRRVRQVLTNLVGNALKFTAEGSVSVNVRRVTDELRFTVQDSGVGISAEDQVGLFERFTQVNHQSGSSTGLGLSISKALVQAMGGTIGVVSKRGQGAMFWFSLPLEEAKTMVEVPAEQGPKSVAVSGSAKILVVDDNPISLMVSQMLLEQQGHEVIVAVNGEDAVAMVQEHSPSLVFMDCHMDVMDGFEATQLIHDFSSTKHLPVIALTANAMKKDQERCLAAGMIDHLAKPFTVKSLNEMLVRHLSCSDQLLILKQ